MELDGLYVTLVARLQVDREGRLLRGELANVEGQVVRRFLNWRGLTTGIRSYLAAVVSAPEGPADDS